MKTEYCCVCGDELILVGVQKYARTGIEEDMMHCDNPDCINFTVTKSYHKRIVDKDAYDLHMSRKNNWEFRKKSKAL